MSFGNVQRKMLTSYNYEFRKMFMSFDSKFWAMLTSCSNGCWAMITSFRIGLGLFGIGLRVFEKRLKVFNKGLRAFDRCYRWCHSTPNVVMRYGFKLCGVENWYSWKLRNEGWEFNEGKKYVSISTPELCPW